MGISIHAPTRGATRINLFSVDKFVISIHAPTRGATSSACYHSRARGNFNPRSHKGSDDCCTVRISSIPEFQSTLPQGERPSYSLPLGCNMIFQSTLPQGERPGFCQYLRHSGDFNPRSHKGSDISSDQHNPVVEISIHAPTRGATNIICPPPKKCIISIHAPTRGATFRSNSFVNSLY